MRRFHILKLSYVAVLLAAILPASAVFVAEPAMQAAQDAAPAQAETAPQNLQVLPKNMTVRQVKEIMDGWTDALGVDCSTCHVRDAANLGPNGKPRFNYADDSKQEKKTARVMYAMTQEINAQFLSKVPNSGIPISCSTCHRGHLSPVPYNSDDDSAPAPAAH
jgi:cytochrome c5